MKLPTKILLVISGIIGLYIAIGRLLKLLNQYYHVIPYNISMVFQYHLVFLPLLSAILILVFIYEVITWKNWAQFYSELVKKGEENEG